MNIDSYAADVMMTDNRIQAASNELLPRGGSRADCMAPRVKVTYDQHDEDAPPEVALTIKIRSVAPSS